jgi:Tol biopolymer transport system component
VSRTPSPARVREVLDLALERPAHERAAYIAGVCGEDRRLRDEVASLMGALETGGELLEPPAAAPAPPAEPLTGLRFGSYHVEQRVGEGGMGVVYRAQDTRLGRTVAVKALPPTLARDPHRRARFEHEARILASLNHPGIAAIHGVEETARGPVLVLEFIPGQTLAQRLARGALPLDEALSIAAQIARGLEAAHAAGVIHRDLKPSNIQITPQGVVKILDFGVAKQAPPISEPQPDAGATIPGSLIGTAAYMSPEQARGRPVDRRTDLWAFGCVLYEMLTGRHAFDGDTSSDTVAAVLRAEPDWSGIPSATPPAVVRLLHRCLEKDPDRRQRDAGDARLELDEPPGMRPGAVRRGWRSPVVAAAVPLALVAGVWAGASWFRDRSAAPPAARAPVRFELNTDAAAPVFVTLGGALAISPDGRTLVYTGGSLDQSRLYARRLDSYETVALPGTQGAGEPCFSPDGRWLAFQSESQLRRVPVAGGGAEVLVPANVTSYGIAWDEHGIVFVTSDPMALCRLSPAGVTESLATLDPQRDLCAMHPEPLPGGRDILITVVGLAEGKRTMRIEAVRAGSGQRRVVVEDAMGARFFPPNRLVFWQAGALVSAPLDRESVRLTDAPAVVVRPIAGGERFPPIRFALSPAGVLATLPGNIRHDLTRLAWYEPNGSWTEVTQGESMDAPRLSPDGTRIAMLIGRATGDVWVHDLARGTKVVLTTGDRHHHPVWMPDGQRIVFTNMPPGEPAHLESVVADGSAAPERLWELPKGVWAYPTDVAPDGRLLLSQGEPGKVPLDLFVFDARSGEPPRRLLPTGTRYGARMSPDGTMIAYTSEETGTTEVYLHRFPSLEPKICVSTSGGYRPVWSGDGKKLFFRYVDRAMAVDVDNSGPEIKLSPVRLVAEHLPDARYDVDHDGRRLLMGRPAGDLGPQTRIDVAVGWDPAHP